ncbi:FKBP-type peptidyl-prolyl cis-trans isomerase [Desulfoprunum benzoelyticum]|uniref:Peptidyl-prolyl cis-trans isomerase n=1 Tax=Desulfoprunum benzoelyticum TaxID=1506996 RepID=A0A840UYP5_9BACT|nr:FKBP-type peptidyl-prolyl cis-trans isomerase [Desulfoprunum benzoelyticum]MBB5346620.1 FKBP-type peptidyl-prolyl cis-trans isomerase 2 [Desulfoprunum benzoelyticum]MBM9529134.1 FKBP-type peptidyl-prolyl cis-trans isomerase [Desulfoprunum benzoelyticum]
MIQPNDTVTLSFTGKLDNGEAFIIVSPDEPLTVTLGNLELPPSVEQALLGMDVGETKKIRIAPDEGFGPRQKELVQIITNQEMIDKLKPQPGMILSLKTEKDGQEIMVPATVVRATDSELEVDYNHPLAGHHLTYTVTIIGIQR